MAKVGSLEAWTEGSGESLPEGSWAHVNHPSAGVFLGLLEFYIETNEAGKDTKVLTWTDYRGGDAYTASEVTHHILVSLPEKP